MTNGEFKAMLEKRTVNFSLNTLKMLSGIHSSAESRCIKDQLIRSATSVGANYREANRAESRADFLHKIAIVVKEAAESEYWLILLQALHPEITSIGPISQEAGELLRLFDSIHRSAQSRS